MFTKLLFTKSTLAPGDIIKKRKIQNSIISLLTREISLFANPGETPCIHDSQTSTIYHLDTSPKLYSYIHVE